LGKVIVTAAMFNMLSAVAGVHSLMLSAQLPP
jgi:hypothetical protein